MVFFVKKDKIDIAFIGLGNPGEEYDSTKHNVGFRVIDTFAQKHFQDERFKNKLDSQVLRGKLDRQELMLAKPQRFMNLSGPPVKWLMKKYPADDLIIIYDDMDLQIGKIKLTHSGGPGSHNGMISIMDAMKGESIKRIRIGIGSRGDMDGADYVLSPFSSQDAELIKSAINLAMQAMEEIIHSGFDRAMNTYNRKDIDEILDEEHDKAEAESVEKINTEPKSSELIDDQIDKWLDENLEDDTEN